MKTFDFAVNVIYDGSVWVEADNLADAERRVRELVKPQGVFLRDLMGDGEGCEMDTHPAVQFLHHSEIPEIPEKEDGA